jgi:hypothetical protein
LSEIHLFWTAVIWHDHRYAMMAKSERLNVLSEAEQFALYGLPDFDDNQRMEYFVFTEPELALVLNRPTLHAQVYCALQIGYFKAKQAFFIFSWEQTKKMAPSFSRAISPVRNLSRTLSPGTSITRNAQRSLPYSAIVFGPRTFFRCCANKPPESFHVR